MSILVVVVGIVGGVFVVWMPKISYPILEPHAENAFNKMDPFLRSKIQKLKYSFRLNKEISIIITTKEPLNEQQKTQIEQKIRIGSMAGSVMTGRGKAKDVIDVASFDFVKYIEYPQKYFPN